MVRRSLLLGSVLVVSGLCATSTASAQIYTRRSFLVPDGDFELTGEPARPELLRLDVSEGNPGEVVSVSPHFYWGASDHVTLGITHRTGLCFSGCDDPPFVRPYDDVGFAILAGLTRSAGFELDLHMGLQARRLDPFYFGLKSGVIGRVTFGGAPVAFVFDPSVYVAFTRRDDPVLEDGVPIPGNRDEVVLPFWFYFQAGRVVVPFVGALFVGPLDAFSDNLAVPVEGGLVFEVSENVDLGLVLRFYNLLGRDPSPDGRSLGMLARFRF